jgi:phenylacetate-CoA ligase
MGRALLAGGSHQAARLRARARGRAGLSASAPVSARDAPAELQDPNALERFQVKRINHVLERARQTPYYAERLRGLPSAVVELAELRAFPVTTKADVLGDLASHPPLGTRTRVPQHAIRHMVSTSGTSGAGQEVYPLDREDEDMVYEMAARGFAWAGIDEGCVVINTLPLGMSAAGQWYYHALRLLGATVLEVGTLTTDEKIQHLRRFGADTLVGTPSYLHRMAMEARRLGFDPAELAIRRFVVAGESWSVRWMRQLEQAWGAKAFEQYGCTQRGMAWSCPAGAVHEHERGTLHALSDFGVYEVVDPATGEPVTEGRGELVLTPFVSSASPLLRFETGDCVTLVSGCDCGRPGPCFAAGSVERYDFMVKVRGVNVWPEALDRAVFEVTAIREYEASVELTEDGRETFEVRIELETPDEQAAARVRERIREIIGLSAQVMVVSDDVISRSIEDRFRKRCRLVDRRGGKGGRE